MLALFSDRVRILKFWLPWFVALVLLAHVPGLGWSEVDTSGMSTICVGTVRVWSLNPIFWLPFSLLSGGTAGYCVWEHPGFQGIPPILNPELYALTIAYLAILAIGLGIATAWAMARPLGSRE